MRTRHLLFLCALVAFSNPAAHLAPTTRALKRSAIDTYAITGARIFPVSGPAIERGTVVIRKGIIAAVGAGVSAPADARVIDGTGLTIYPGLIDANTTLGVPQPSPPAGERRGGAGTGAAAPSLAAAAFSPGAAQPDGLRPETLAADLIQPGAAEIEAARNAGITSALVAPREGILMGQSAFINLAGETPEQMIVRSPVALHVGFAPLRSGVYPSSLMGVFSALRQMLLDAGRLREANQIYARSPRGLRRPVQDRSLLALQPALARELPVVMHVNTEREIRRALDLAEEFNLRIIISGGAESWKVTDRLKGVPVLLSLNFPKRTTAQVPEADPDPLRVLRERVDAPKTAGRLAAAHIRFAFQSGALSDISDYLANAAKTIEQGLARDEALRALTINAAEILGVADRLGTIEVGKIANLTVTRGDLFDRSTRVVHVFIDGRPVDLKPATPAASTPGAGVSGTWSLNVTLGEGDQSVTLVLQQEGENLRGSIQGTLGSAQIANASVTTGGELRFTVPITIGGQTTEATFTGTITGNQMRGTVQAVGQSPGTFTGTRPGAATPTATPSRTPPPAQPNAPPAASANIAGTWTLSLTVGLRDMPGTLTIRQQGSNLSGTLQSPFGTTELSDGSIGADGFRFTTSAIVEGRTVEMTITGTASGNQMNGHITSEIGSTVFTGTRPQRQ